MMVMKAGNASADCSQRMRTTFIIMSAPTVMSAGPIAYGGTFAAEAIDIGQEAMLGKTAIDFSTVYLPAGI